MNQLTMSTISFKLSAYLFILFLPIFFFRTFSADISLRDFLIMFVVLFFCITWQKHILKKYKSDGGILNAAKSKTSIAATILLALCVQFIVLKIVMNICIFINIFVMNNLWLINYNVHKIMLVIIAVFLLVGYFVLRHGYKHYSILSKAAMFITIALMLVAIFATLPTLFIKSYESLEVISTFDETMTLAVQLFSIFGVWLLVASIVTYDEKRKKIAIV